jgi:hypothetical protein
MTTSSIDEPDRVLDALTDGAATRCSAGVVVVVVFVGVIAAG